MCSIPAATILAATTIILPSGMNDIVRTPEDIASLAGIILLGALIGSPFGLIAAGGAWLGFVLAHSLLRIERVWLLILYVAAAAGVATLAFAVPVIALAAPDVTPWQTLYANSWLALLLMSSIPALIGCSIVVGYRIRHPAPTPAEHAKSALPDA